MPGEQLLALLRAEPATGDIPVVVLSADATQHHMEQLRAAGVAAYLTKPIAVRELLRTFDRLLHRPGSQHEQPRQDPVVPGSHG
jgi:CheY-like chemotaxis protein